MTEAFVKGFSDEYSRLVKSASGLLGYIGDVDGPKEGYRAGAPVLRQRSGAPAANAVNSWNTQSKDTAAFGAPGALDATVPEQAWAPPSNEGMPSTQQKYTATPINSTIGAKTTINPQQPVARTSSAPSARPDVRVSVRRKGSVGPSGTVLASRAPLPNGVVYNNTGARAKANL